MYIYIYRYQNVCERSINTHNRNYCHKKTGGFLTICSLISKYFGGTIRDGWCVCVTIERCMKTRSGVVTAVARIPCVRRRWWLALG